MYRFKYRDRQEYASFYARELSKKHGKWIRWKQIDVIVPVPLHKRKKKLRGYNQAELVARELGKRVGIPVRTDVLIRCVDTKPQKEVSGRERKQNLRSAFRMRKTGVQLKNVLVIDDIYTTGSTIDGVAATLKTGGVQRVYFLSVSIGNGY
ncbi:hypothetical protein FACS1894111_12480 [Clostridia bacterium]|nr:hypothetical protein FACS1894111_12480 [Clostridia bacterium]